MEGVVAHDVALLRHAADDVRGGLHHVPHHKEGGGGMVLFQSIQDFFRIAVFITTVKGQVDDLLPGVAQVIGVVFRQVLRCGVAHGGLPFIWKGEAPVVGGGRDQHGGGGGQGFALYPEHPRQKQAGKQQGQASLYTLTHKHPP